MSEYWVSKKKYWCQYCETFIADDAPSRTQHENGLRHKGNKERYIRGLYKTGIKKKQESEEEKRAMKLVEAAAQAAFARDVSSGSAPALHPSSVASTSKPKPPPRPVDPFTNYTTAQSLGITDPDAEFQAAEERKKNEGIAGEWVSVVPPPPPLPDEVDSTAVSSVETTTTGQIRKRDEESVVVDEDDTRRFKLRRKTVAIGLGEIYDPGVIKVKPRMEVQPKEEDEEGTPSHNPNSTHSSFVSGTEKPVWVSRGWKKAGEPTSTTTSSESQHPEETFAQNSMKEKEELKIKPEHDPTDIPMIPELETRQEEANQVVGETKKEEEQEVPLAKLVQSDASTTALFRKRKVPVNSTTGKRKDR